MSADEIESNEIGGVNDRRRSNRAGFRSCLTFRSLLQQFPPIRGLLVCDDTDVSQISRFLSAPFVGAPQETSHTPWTSWPQAPESRHFASRQSWQVVWPLSHRGSGVGSEQQGEASPLRHWWAGLSTPVQAWVKPCICERDRPSFPPGRDGLAHGPSFSSPMSGIGSVARENNRLARTLTSCSI